MSIQVARNHAYHLTKHLDKDQMIIDAGIAVMAIASGLSVAVIAALYYT